MLNLLVELSMLDHVEVELIPQCQRGEFGPWEFRERAEDKAMEGEA